jgi:exodeoxyribonuclease V gamma subunit
LPDLHVITSNRLEILIDKLAEMIAAAPLSSPLDSEIITVQSQGMARWIALELAERHGICANCQFPFPNALIDLIDTAITGDNSTGGFNPDIATWQIILSLQQLHSRPEFGAIRNYLRQDNNHLKLYQLSHRLADLFDQYTIYRPEMIIDWSARPVDHWQAILWKDLVANYKIDDRSTRLKNLIEQINTLSSTIDNLPSRISIFGISTLPPVYIKLFEALSRLIDINLFITNPCREYWADILTDKESDRIIRKTADGELPFDDLHIEPGNSLLASMGTLGRDFFDLLVEHGEQPFFADPESNTLLSSIQADILNLHERGTAEHPRSAITPEDDSLVIHSCHSPMREIEALYDNLLAMFEADPGLRPRDIIVMTPDIETYSPYIKAIFGSVENDSARIPFTIADRSYKTENPFIEALMAIIELSGSRFEVSRVMAILELPIVHRRFDLTAADIDTITGWVKDVNIRWGIDKNQKTEFGLPETYENTWRFGLDRLLLGYALPGKSSKLFDSILPYDYIEGETAQILGRFAEFISQLFAKVNQLNHVMTLSEWAGMLLSLCDELFIADDESEPDLQRLRKAFTTLAESGNQAGYTDTITLDVIKQYLKDKFTVHGSGSGFIAGSVTFCAMLPMRSIPFKTICLIGLNNDAYPRQAAPMSFDLIATNPKPGDRSIRNTDRYIFLEAILSAREKLYLSYIGQSIQDNTTIPPSVLVSELLDYINQGFYIERQSINDHLLIRHHLQAFSPEYFKHNERLFSYSKENYAAAKSLIKGDKHTPVFFADNLPAPDDDPGTIDMPAGIPLGIDDLCRFFVNPSKYLLNRRLGIYLDESAPGFDDTEPFLLRGLDRYQIEDDLLGRFLRNEDIDNQYEIHRASGRLPQGVIGREAYKNIADGIKALAQTIEPYRKGTLLPSLTLNIKINDFLLTGTIDNFYESGRLQYRPASIKAKDILSCWIKHLALNTANDNSYPKTSVLIGSDMIYKFKPVENCLSLLDELVKIYRDGLIHPLHLFLESSYKFIKELAADKTEGRALMSARFTWRGGDFSRGERDDSYLRLCFGNSDPLDREFINLASTVFKPILNNIENVK